MSVTKKSLLLIFIVLLIDQVSKFYIKLNFRIGESIEVFSWFQIYFIENNGMAFGMEIFGKLFLTLFRIVAVGGLGYFIYYLIKKGARTGFVLSVALLLAGAAGNIFDSVLYGVLFNDSYGQVASFLPAEGGYAPLFYGKVVDMLYFPLIVNEAGETLFFSPVFNVADSAISVAAAIILLFYRKDLNEHLESDKSKKKEVENA
ncbi:MAG: lipoprotein signal peptidase [Bacteroidales bacterium]|jgi:signal peptidase II|nr:lipoprotein signal peptidase [Bacteroidales bacterium]ODT55514.1 MAG: lipoprotein signal peptidase [Paludibacter sp. SCN 50-10]ODU60483.1 MAG: lipoprotein signal peptidase [Paludibacter sp. SCN 51-9]OJX87748.1 MAG: lipoprotein signal peptidase [Paludibacter sp. 47-17]